MAVFSCVFNSEIPVNFQLKKVVFSKNFHMIKVAEYHKQFAEMIADFHV